MRIKFFHTPKPRQFSFHTRYYDEKKLDTEDNVTLERGSFSKYKNKYRSNPFEKEFAVKERNRKLIILSIILAFTALYLTFLGFYSFGAVPAIGVLIAVYFILRFPSN